MNNSMEELKIESVTFLDNQQVTVTGLHREIMQTARSENLILLKEENGVGTLVRPAQIIIKAIFVESGTNVEIANSEFKKELQLFYRGSKFDSKLVDRFNDDIKSGEIKLVYIKEVGYKIIRI